MTASIGQVQERIIEGKLRQYRAQRHRYRWRLCFCVSRLRLFHTIQYYHHKLRPNTICICEPAVWNKHMLSYCLLCFQTFIKMHNSFLRSCSSAEGLKIYSPMQPSQWTCSRFSVASCLRIRPSIPCGHQGRLKSTMLVLAFESFAFPWQVSACIAALKFDSGCLLLYEKHHHRVPIV